MAWAARREQEPDLWEVAASTPVSRTDEPGSGDEVGVLVARRHATGWFVHGLRSSSLPPEEAEDFAAFVTVRVYQLLLAGPRHPVWERGPAHHEWRAVLTRPEAREGAVPDTPPRGR